MNCDKQFEIKINERSTATFTATLYDKDENGLDVPIAAVDVDEIRMTLVDVATGEVINGRTNQDVFDDNDCTLHPTDGTFTWAIQIADTPIVGATEVGIRETHLATITVTWGGGQKQQHFQVTMLVLNLMSVPQEES